MLGTTLRRSLTIVATAALAAALLVLVPASPAAAEGIEVTTTEDELNGAFNGTSLREAIAQASDAGNDTIRLQRAATYELDLCDASPAEEDLNQSGDLDWLSQSGLKTIEGQGSTIEQTCPGEDVIDLRLTATLRLEDLTIEGGSRSDGGAVAGNGGIQLDGVTLQRNERGLYSPGSGAVVDVVDSTVTDNDQGLITSLASQVTLQDSTVSGNDTYGVHAFESPLDVVDSVVSDNGDGTSQGGVAVTNAALEVERSTFIGNDGFNGGGLRLSDATATVSNSTIIANGATNGGGGIGLIDVNGLPGSVALDHVTVAGNTTLGSGIANNLYIDGALEVTATAVGQDDGQDSCALFGLLTSHGGNVESASDCSFNQPGDRQDVGPLGLGFISPGDDPGELVRVPGFASPLVDTQPAAECGLPAVDQVGQVRGNDGDFDQEQACDAGAVERPRTPPFVDVAESHPFFDEIGWMAWNQISLGFQPGPEYRPLDPVSRQAMSAFMYRLAGEPPFAPPAGPTTFVDVPGDHPFFKEIEWMADEGISTGYQPGPEYRPADPVSRQAMSAFMYRLAGEPPFTAPGNPTFSDVPTGHPFFAEVEWMASEGISTGYGDGTYKPAVAVSRQAMSAFMFRLFPLLP